VINLKKFINLFFIFFLIIGHPVSYSFADIAPTTLPTGGNVVSGNITISTPDVGKMNVNQTSSQGIINWDTFNVGSSAAVHFNQPGVKSSILNNVLSGTSIINGSIFSNGRLIFVNPTGILTGPTSAIRSEGAILSTLKITNTNFLNNNYTFTTNSSSSITTQGNINGEYVALLSPVITNKGTITTNVATALVAGDDIRLSISDSNLLTVAVNPSKLKTFIKNEGNIKTQNGIVTLKTDVAQSVVDEVIKTENAKANGLVTENGVVKLVINSGTIKAKEVKLDAGSKGASEISGNLNSNSETGKGGYIEVTAKEIDINAATISADGKKGGGEILLGGDWQGAGDLLQATFLSIDNGSKITADALQSGSGGKIVAWTNIKDTNSNTIVNGILSAKGIDGDGGKIETSGASINTDGIRINAGSTSGASGLWLIDPYDYTINSAAATNITNALNSGTNVTVLTSANSSAFGSGGSSSGNGDITITSNIGTTAGSATSSTLTLTAARHIVSNSGITIGDGGSHSLSLAFTAGGNITFNGAVDVEGTVSLTTTTYSSSTSTSFSYTGAEQTWAVPTGVTSITVDGYGAGGGYGYSDPGAPGKGGRVQATLATTAGQTLYLYLGEQGGNSRQSPGTGAQGKWVAGDAEGGFNGGGDGRKTHYSAGGGGGATDIRQGGNSLSNRIYVAGGGGGQGSQRRGSAGGGNGGAGGGTTGQAGSTGGGGGASGGGGGTASAGGSASSQNNGTAATGGSLGQGGHGAGNQREGGGGGGGYYGGGGGGSHSGAGGGGGGGGSSYTVGTASSVTHTQGYASATGNGSLSISYTASSTGAITINQGIASSGNTTISTQGALTVKESSSANFGTIAAASVSVNNSNADIVLNNSPTVSGASTFDNTGKLWFKNGGTFTGGLEITNDDDFLAKGNITSTDNDITLKFFKNCVTGIGCGLNVNSGGGAIVLAGGYTSNNNQLNVTSSGGSTNTITNTGNTSTGQFGRVTYTAETVSLSGTDQVANQWSYIRVTAGTLDMNNSAVLKNNAYFGGTVELIVDNLINPGRVQIGQQWRNTGALEIRPRTAGHDIEFNSSNDASITTDGFWDSDLNVDSWSQDGQVTLRLGSTSDTRTQRGSYEISSASSFGGTSSSGDYYIGDYDQKVLFESNTTGTTYVVGALGSSNLGSYTSLGATDLASGASITTNSISFQSRNYVSPGNIKTLGVLNVSGNAALSTNSSGGTAPTMSFGGLTGSGNLSSDTDMTIGTSNTNGIYSGVLSGSMALSVKGTGVYEPKGTNTYTGGTVIDGGIIAAFNDRNWGALPSSLDSDNIILKNGGKAIFGSKNSSNTTGHTYWKANRGINLPTSGQQFIEMGSGGSGAAHIEGIVNGIGGITFTRSGSKAIRFYGENTYTGDTKFNFTSGSNNNIEIKPKAFQNSTVYLSPTKTNVGRGFSRTSGSGNIILGGLAGDMTDWRLVGANRNVEFGSNNANTSVAGGISRYASASNLIKKGTGTTTFTATSGQELNNSSIGLQVDAGKLVLNGDWGRNNTSAGTVAIASGATLQIDTAQNNTYSGVLSGTGNLLLGGTGTSTFSGNNTFAGTLNIADGGFKAGHANSFGSATLTSSGGRISMASSITLPSLTVTGNVQLDSGITTTGDQIYNNNVVVKAGSRATAAVISATNSDISFMGTLKGEGNAKNRSLNINAGTGDVLFGNRVGYAFNGVTVNINNTADSFYKMTVTGKDITVKGDVMTYEEQTYNGNVLIGSTASNGTTRTFLSMDPKVIFNGSVNDTVEGKHTLIAKAIEINRGSNATPTVQFKSTVGRTTKLAAYSGLTGYQSVGANWGVINASSPFGTTVGTGQTMGPVVSSGDNGKKAARGIMQFAKTFTAKNNTLNFSSFRFGGGGNSFNFKKNVDIIYGDSSQFGGPANTFKSRSGPGNTKQGGLFGGFFGKTNPNLGPTGGNAPDIRNDQFSSKGNNELNNFREPKDIKELFKNFEGGNSGKGKFFNPYGTGEKGLEQKNNNPNDQQNVSNISEEEDV
jgi:filamentous hemagglutinin family protein